MWDTNGPGEGGVVPSGNWGAQVVAALELVAEAVVGIAASAVGLGFVGIAVEAAADTAGTVVAAGLPFVEHFASTAVDPAEWSCKAVAEPY